MAAARETSVPRRPALVSRARISSSLSGFEIAMADHCWKQENRLCMLLYLDEQQCQKRTKKNHAGEVGGGGGPGV